MTTYSPKLIELIDASIREVFGSVGARNVDVAQNNNVKSMGNAQFSASLGFSGDLIKGALVIFAGSDLLQATNPQRDFGRPLKESDHGDWIGEMANQIVGAIKRRAAGYKVDFLLSTPTTMRGDNLHLTHSPKVPAAVFMCDIDQRPAQVHFAATLEPEAKFEGEPDTSEQVASGDTLFF